jgi:3-deoxy-manno-octulosonate cytidylyltransferase (CMP-KDO synthetase)
MLKQVCIIPFLRDFLLEYNLMEQTPLEIIESVDMNRLLENGIKIKMILCKEETYSVDTPADLKNVNEKMVDDPLLDTYML